jgi:catecholate siderophore receptor
MTSNRLSLRSPLHSLAGRRWLVAGALAATGALAPSATATAQVRAAAPNGRTTDTDGDRTVVDAAGLTLQDTPGPARTYAIPAGPLSDVLAALGREAGVTIDARADLGREIASAGVTGSFTLPQALSAALQGTGFTARVLSPTSVIVEVRIDSESVDVTAGLPRVASPRYPTSVTETPQTLQVIPRATIEQQGAFSLGDVLRNVPGITLQAGEGGGASNTAGEAFNMRGFNANNSMFVDGVRDDGLIARDTFNLEQVEVFLGPTGTDVGRGTGAGYVNMVTKAPRPSSGYGGTLAYGTKNQTRATVDLNVAVPIGEDGSWLSRSAVRLNGLFQDGGVAGRDEVENERRALAPSLSMGLGTATRVTVSGQFMRQDNVPDYGLPGAAHPDGPLVVGGANASGPVDQTNFYGTPAADYDDVSQDSYLGKVEHDVRSGLTLRNQIRYNRTHREALISTAVNPAAYNPATETVTITRQANERENEILSNQTSASIRVLRGNLTHEIDAGVEFLAEDQYAPAFAGMGTRDPISIYAPNPNAPIVGFDLVPSGAYTKGGTDTIAGYLFDTVNVGRLQFSGGLRLDRYDTTYDSMATTGVLTSIDADGTVWSGKAGVLYRLHPLGNVYASVGRAVTPPGTANFTLSAAENNANNPNVDPQISINYEVGTKWDLFERRLSASLATFLTKNSNVIYTVDATTVPPTFNQDDRQKVTGVALGLVGRIKDDWDVMFNMTVMNSENQSQNPAVAGRWLTLTPETSGSVWTTYRTPINLRIGGGLRYQGDSYVNAGNTIVLPSATVFDAMAEYPLRAALVLRLNVYNLTDERYIRSINNNGGRYNPGATRSALVSLAFNF